MISKIPVILFKFSHFTFITLHILGNPENGISLNIVMQRRIINEILTTYLPTFFILAIVYATNFFKPFFFEAVVTVNLTSQLVLTTLFISVSKSLPPTAYVKMIDVWLIFSQLIPFVEVILHTYMDCLRNNDERQVNHHGQAINVVNGNSDLFTKRKKSGVPTYKDMTQRNEEGLVEARKKFYELTRINVDLLKIGDYAGSFSIRNYTFTWFII